MKVKCMVNVGSVVNGLVALILRKSCFILAGVYRGFRFGLPTEMQIM